MAIFNEIGKKISQTTQSALKSTKDLADISRIHSQISDQQKLLNSFFIQMGETYYQLYKDTPDENFSSLCTSVTESKLKIEALTYEIQKIKGIKNCAGCGAEVPLNTAFCGTCGYDTRKEETPVKEEVTAIEEALKCPNCNKELEDGLAFCTDCGHKL